ncbi:MAG: hypothetical protein MPK11_02270 [Gammaproteobacteria bacterium]|nr:hypothetical protein [Gammaproteobacteria bacterium]MDA7969592.1 hypothetical protein [Gammaproteobacteria bacterium]MDA7995332.1 hypothetical protein [Gammaproteobacteria bacterium]
MKKAFKQASKPPSAKRKAAKLRADEKWERLFAKSADALDALAADALEDYRLGKTEEYARGRNVRSI